MPLTVISEVCCSVSVRMLLNVKAILVSYKKTLLMFCILKNVTLKNAILMIRPLIIAWVDLQTVHRK